MSPGPDYHAWTHRPKEYGGTDPLLPYGVAVYAIEVFEPDQPVIVQDNLFELEIPEDLVDATLVSVDAYLTTPSTSGTVQVQLSKESPPGSTGDDLLSTKISIDVGYYNMKDATTQPVIDEGVATFEWGDHIRVDVDNAGTGAEGLGLILYLTRSVDANIVIRGAKGDPGGVNNFTGGYDSGSSYSVADAVSNGGSSYVAIVDNPTTEPGVDPGWEDEWMLLAQVQNVSSVEYVIDGSGYVIDIGEKAAIRVPYDCTLTECEMLADLTGSMVVGIWKDTYANYPPTNADSITSSSPPTLASQSKSIDTVLSGWTTALAEDDILLFSVDSCSTITRVTISLKFLKT